MSQASNQSERVTATFRTVARPIRSASLFYALYYLVEIEGDAEAAFDFKQERERQQDGFYQYGRFAMLSEFTHAADRYFIVGERAGGADFFTLQEHASEFLFPDDARLESLWLAFMNRADELNGVASQRNPVGMQDALEIAEGILARNGWAEDELVLALTRFFDAMPDQPLTSGQLLDSDKTGWVKQFDGPAWSSIGRHLQRVDELSATAFVDQSWSIEHNNNRWIDKIHLEESGRELNALQAVMGEGGLEPRDFRGFANFMRALNMILDAARDGKIVNVFEWALHFEHDVEANLRRLARNAGVLV